MFSIAVVFGVDPSSHIGRVDYASLPHQALMELLISGMTTNKETICGDSQEEAAEIAKWSGVTLDEQENVLYFNWAFKGLGGEVHLAYLPETVEKANVSHNFLSGSLDLTGLPSGLQYLYLQNNDFSGETDFSKLPKLSWLNISNTQLEGEIFFKNANYFVSAAHSKVKIIEMNE